MVSVSNEKLAVQSDPKTFERIMEALENISLYNNMISNNQLEVLNLDQAKKYYKKLKKRI
ncbi:MAG: hypothetical protein J0L67_12365 [Cytophagales bacterium]|nr:hypothetical protein [Cytophagales bacterium]